jgi:SAM-dependent methyltransferase
MPMNRMHQRICASAKWAAMIEQALPERLAGVDLGEDVLEIGPGYGATTRVLAAMAPKLTAVEVDKTSADTLAGQFAGQVRIVHGSGADLPFEDGSFSGVCCFTMLHHVPSPELQDALFAQACRVLRPGGVFAGSDSQLSLRFRLIHLGDTMVVVDPDTLAGRLTAAGFTDVRIRRQPKKLVVFSARKP